MAGGRPPFEVTQAVLDRVEHCASIGLNLGQTAAVLGISYETLNERRKEFPEINQIIEKGKSIGVEGVAGALHDKAMSGDITAIKYYLGNRAKDDWSDRQGITIDGQLDTTVEFIGLPETVERINEIISE